MKEIVAKIFEIPCVFLNENEKVLDMDEIIKEFILLVIVEVNREDFSLSLIDKLLDLQFILNFLDSLLKKHKKCCIDLEDSITSVKVITDNTQGVDGGQMKNALQKFKEFQNRDSTLR